MNILYGLLCVVIGLIPAVLIYRKDRQRQIPVKWLPAVFRFLCFFFTAALLLAPVFSVTKTSEMPATIIWLQDRSISAGTALGEDSSAYRQEVTALWQQWTKHQKVVPLAFGSRVSRDSLFTYDASGTDITGALQQALQQYQDRNIGAIVVATDGNFNQGLNPLFARFPEDIPVYTVGIGDSTIPQDIRISKVYANKTVALNHQFEIIVDIQAEKLAGTASEALLLEDDAVVSRSPVLIASNHYTGSVQFMIKADKKGLRHYQVVVKAARNEANRQNNKKDVYVSVIEKKKKILLLAAAPHPDIAAIKSALSPDDQYELTIHYGWNIPKDASGYQLIIAHQLPSMRLQSKLPSAGIPVWYILGEQSDLPTFSKLQSLVQPRGAARATDVIVDPDVPPFAYFTLPAGLSGVLAKMPPLQVPATEFSVSGAAQVLLWGKAATTGSKIPLWVFREQGLPMAILTGTGIWRWRIFDYKNNKNHETIDWLIRHTVRFLTAREQQQPFRVYTNQPVFNDNEPVMVYATLRNASGALINTPDPELLLKDSSGKTIRYRFEKENNRYRLNLGLLAAGAYTFEGRVTFDGTSHKSAGAFQVAHQSLELLKSHSDYALLYQLAERSGGSFFTRQQLSKMNDVLLQDKHLKPVLAADTVHLHWIDKKWIFLLILCCATAEWLLRKYWGI